MLDKFLCFLDDAFSFANDVVDVIGNMKDAEYEAKILREIDETAGQGAAQLALIGADYHNGENGKPQNSAIAALYFMKAAEMGDDGAQNVLGVFYWQGIGVTEDLDKARHWLLKSYQQCNAAAAGHLGILLLSDEHYDPNISILALEYAGTNGDAESQTHLINYYIEHDVLRDYEKAAYWARKAAENGVEGAEELYKGLKEEGHIDTPLLLFGMYTDGEYGKEKDMEKAAYWRDKIEQE